MKKTVKKILGDPQEQALKRMKKVVTKINALEKNYEKLSNSALKKESLKLRERAKTEDLDKLLPESFAIVREASRRVIGQRHFDVQLIGGMVLHEGKVAEMKTGEGKTLMETLPVYLNALSGKGVHVVTVNDYLAQRDAGWMAKIYDALGMSVGVIIPESSFIYDADFEDKSHFDERFWNLKPATRKEAYAADITYGTNNEFGFDYMRDNMVAEVGQLRQRDLNFAIVDEVDSILIDEARTPLIISSSVSESGAGYRTFAELVTHLEPGDYVLEEKRHAVNLTDAGIDKIEELLNIDNLYDPKNVHHIFHLEQALKAQTLFKKDKDYVVTKDGEVVIVDSFTGRLLPGRRYSEGLHQAIEAKESVKVNEESVTLATISFQNYFRLYDKLAGMTGTAKTEEEEFVQVYGMDVVEVPSNRKIIRKDRNDKIYATEKAKFKAIVDKVRELNETGQPVLIGTVSIEKNEVLSSLLSAAGIKHHLLNAKNNESEALIVSKAGEKGSVTLATNIAGRGTDIVLTDEVKELGGLFVLGSERHDSRRIDNQLRGRSGRQGDPGETQFYISAEDELMRVFGGETLSGLMVRLGAENDDPIEKKSISRAIERSQKLVEGMNFDARKQVVQYDDVMNRHRRAVYSTRRAMLLADNDERIDELVWDSAKKLAKADSENLFKSAVGSVGSDDFEQVLEEVSERFNLRPKAEEEIASILKFKLSEKKEDEASEGDRSGKKGATAKIKSAGAKLSPLNIPANTKKALKGRLDKRSLNKKRRSTIKKLEKILVEAFEETQEKLEKASSKESLRGFQRALYMQILDELWMQHLENMQHLRNGIGWRGVGQRDPLVEYRFEGQRIFDAMMYNLRSAVVAMQSQINPKSLVKTRVETELTKAAGRSVDNADEILGSVQDFDADDFRGTTRIIEVAEGDEGSEVIKTVAKPKPAVQQRAKSNKSSKNKAKKKQRQNRKKGRR